MQGLERRMSSYRIIKYTNKFYETFKVQKKSFIGLWYNFNNIDGCTTGVYDTKAEAQEAINRHRSKATITIIDA
jgi:RNase P protein component